MYARKNKLISNENFRCYNECQRGNTDSQIIINVFEATLNDSDTLLNVKQDLIKVFCFYVALC